MVSQETQENRVIQSRRLFNKVNPLEEPDMPWFFYKKNFAQNKKVNRRNDRWRRASPDEVFTVMQTKFLSSAMVLAIASNEGHVVPPYFLERGLSVNTKDFIVTLGTVVKTLDKRVARGTPYIFQRDSASCHTAHATQDWLADNFYNHVTPNVSLLNPQM